MRAVFAVVAAVSWLAFQSLAPPAAAQCIPEETGSARVQAGIGGAPGRVLRIADDPLGKVPSFTLTQPAPYHPYQARPPAGMAMGPTEVAAGLRARGFLDIGTVRQRGRTFLAEATGPRGERVRLVIDGASGEISGMQIIGYRTPQ